MACKCISKKVAKVTLCILLIILALSVVLIILFPTIYDDVLKKELTLGKGTIVTDIWVDIPIPLYQKLFFFNITNKEAFLDGSEPLSVTEVGPYVYKSRWVKNNLQWNSNNTVSYRELRTYQFVPDKSKGTEEDVIHTLNGPMIIASSLAKDYNINLRALLSVVFGLIGDHIVITKSIRELVYDGYEDMIIKFAPILKPDIPYKNGIFSWLYGKNATDDGLFTVFTGVDDSSKLNHMNNWNGEDRMTFWKGDTCNMLNGTNIEVGPPIQGYQETYTFFQSIFCRSITFNYTEDVRHFDILSKRFRPTYDIFANSTENPDNYCFEVDKEYPSGISDISPCQFGSPVFLSFPHFYLADPSYLRSVNGLNPNDEDHGSHLDVEIITGVTINTAVRFQINVEINKVEGIFQTYNVTKGIFPVLWVELNIAIDEDKANFLKGKLKNPKIIAYSFLGVLVGISLILAIFFLVVLYISQPDDEDEPLIDATDRECRNIESCKIRCGCTSYDKECVSPHEKTSEGYSKSTAPCEYSCKNNLGASQGLSENPNDLSQRF